MIASGAQLDPPPAGDENEHPEAVDLAIDGDPSTVWYTRTYGTPQFGGLKDGLGYAVTLAEPAPVSTVTLQVRGSGGASRSVRPTRRRPPRAPSSPRRPSHPRPC
ncbi:hypothetical protein [Cellulomonas sp. ATA003]|uniref:hypothetical protein n=1 Tax=Cellulomonas sp. ATA003 TaxID=3073064 RepID=UPI00287361DE|nr:hypothetical protein [Cellulomonas sp. ATA003]WNB85597.1 hypothetical protein REH70_19065 [Cellulomonas sp. ATA003]